MKLGMQDLRNLGKPVIAFIRGGHFNVIKEVTGTGVIIADKDTSETEMPKNEFQQSWDGYVLLVEKAA
jgi:ABC-type bacteriocin/lantibiotic exporter with double-glycine peptidase domain